LKNILPANLPSGIVSSIGFALAGSDHPNLPISVKTTVGFTAFTLIWEKKAIIISAQVMAMLHKMAKKGT